MATTASARMSIGAVFATVGTAATAVSSVLDGVTSGMSMFEAYVNNAQVEQRERIAADSVNRRKRIADEISQEITERKVATIKFKAQSANHELFYASAYDEVMQAIEASSPAASTTAERLRVAA